MSRLVCLIVAGLFVAGCSGSGPDVDSLRVTDSTTLDPPVAGRLSPDGTRVLETNREPCVREVSGDGRWCVEDDDVAPDLLNAVWSPDGSKVAFTNDFWRLAHEPDLWVFEVESGDLRNLTDDGQDRYDFSGDNDDALIDLLPSWSSDGDTIRFVRGRAKGESVELVSVPADGGDVSTLREVDCATTKLIGLAWSDTRVAWSCGLEKADLYLADQTGGEPERVFPAQDGQDWMLLSFSPDGQWLLADSLRHYGTAGRPEGGHARVVPAEGGDDPVPISDQAGFPTWSPDGHALAYVEFPDRLMVVDEPGGQARELRRAETSYGASDGRRLSWAQDRLLVFADQAPAVLTLDS